MSAEGSYRNAQMPRQNTHYNRDETCISVVRDRAQEAVLMHVGGGEERRASFVREDEYLWRFLVSYALNIPKPGRVPKGHNI